MIQFSDFKDVQPLPMKATLISAPRSPLGTLYYVWKQSRHNRPIPSANIIEAILTMGSMKAIAESKVVHTSEDVQEIFVSDAFKDAVEQLGFDREDMVGCAKHIREELQMILHEGIPVVENLHFVFHLENIPISLREQLVRHRIGTSIDQRVGSDIVPDPFLRDMLSSLPAGSVMNMQVIPDLAESTWWSQTSRVIPFTEFYDEGRFLLPESLQGKICKTPDGQEVEATQLYKELMYVLQESYKSLMEAGVHIEDCRNIIPVGSTHGITWGLNLKAMLHIFGKRSSWIAQVGIWGQIMGQMAKELREKVHPMFGMVLQPQCLKKGKYVGCPVAGTNAERIAGIDGMPPCPLWVRNETPAALQAATDAYNGKFPGVLAPAWNPPIEGFSGDAVLPLPIIEDSVQDIRNWTGASSVETEMLSRNSEMYSELWGFDVNQPIQKEL